MKWMRLTNVLFLLACMPAVSAREGKMTAAELIQAHVKALGTPEARNSVLSLGAEGTGSIEFLSAQHMLPRGSKAEGSIVLQESGSQIVLRMDFDHRQFSADGFRYDGSRVLIDRFDPTAVSGFGQMIFPELGYFVGLHDRLLRDGFLGGALRNSWALLSLDAEKDKVKYRGLKKEEGRELHTLEYRLPKVEDGSIKVTLYFEPGTFRHVLTKYAISDTIQRTESRTVANRGGEMSTTSVSESRRNLHELEERFADFREVDGLDLPHTWSINLRREIYPLEAARPKANYGQRVTEWHIFFSRITHNQP